MKTDKVELEKGKYVRIKGKVTIYSPYQKQEGRWIGGSSWTVKNPLIRIGKCDHKPKKVFWVCERDLFNKKTGKRFYFKKGKEQIICSDCGYIIKLGEVMNATN